MPLLVAVFVLVGCAPVDRDAYVLQNLAVLNGLPRYPGAIETSVSSTGASLETEGPVVAYTTLALLRLPAGATPAEVELFYRQELRDAGWRLTGRADDVPGPILGFQRGNAFVGINLESWRGRILEVVVDHDQRRATS